MGVTATIGILDRDDLSRNGIAAIISRQLPDVEVCAVWSCRHDLEAALRTAPLDLLLIHDTFPDTVETRQILDLLRLRAPATAAVVLSPRLMMGYIEQLLGGGANAFIYSGDALEDLLPTALHTALNGGVFLSPSAALLPYRGQPHSLASALSGRDLQVLRLLQDGFTVLEIAHKLAVDRKTVYRTRDRLRQVLGVRTNEQIVPMAAARGLL